MKKPKKRTDAGAKAVSADKWDGFSPAIVGWDFRLPGTNYDYVSKVGDGLRSSVVVAALSYVMRAFPEAPVIVESKEQEQWRTVDDHPLAQLIRQPNPYYSGRCLWMATAMEFYAFGEAFWLKVRNGAGAVVELWWIPRALIEPKQDLGAAEFITHYDYKVGGETIRLALDDVVHFRFGFDPNNIRRGFYNLASVFREVYVDDQASNFTASILRNLGIIGLLFAPDGTATIPPGKLGEFKDYVEKNFTGDKRGNAMAFSVPMKAQLLQYNLQGFDVGPIRDIAEERVCALTGLPAAVVGFGTGLQQTKVGATMREMVQLAWRGSLMPTQEILADELDRSLLPEFQKQITRFRVKFDTSSVRALWEDEQQKSDRLLKALNGGAIELAEWRRDMGYEVRAEHRVYYLPSTIVVKKKPEEEAPPKPAPAPVDPSPGDPNAAGT